MHVYGISVLPALRVYGNINFTDDILVNKDTLVAWWVFGSKAAALIGPVKLVSKVAIKFHCRNKMFSYFKF